jgi:hypothetical protein
MAKKHHGSLESWFFWTYVFTQMRFQLDRMFEISLQTSLNSLLVEWLIR